MKNKKKRAMGFEPMIFCLEGRRCTAQLHPQWEQLYTKSFLITQYDGCLALKNIMPNNLTINTVHIFNQQHIYQITRQHVKHRIDAPKASWQLTRG